MQRRAKLLTASAATIVSALIVWGIFFRVNDKLDPPPMIAPALEAGVARSTPPAPPPMVVERASSTVPKQKPMVIDYGKEFAHATDYWKFAHQLLPAAHDGNADAQFYLWNVLNRCASDNKMYFQRAGQVLTKSQGLDWADRRNLSQDVAQTVYDRCHEFLVHDSSEFGKASDWLAQATDAGQPQAQAATATQRITQQTIQTIQTTNATSGDAPSISADAQTPNSLLRLAVESKNPDVLFAIGEAQSYLASPGTDTTVNQLAWWLVACERGLDCSTTSDWVKVVCFNNTQCASVTNGSEFVQMLATNNWSRVQAMADQINAKLDAGDWDDLGLGS